jgi:hypothetical protein
MRSVALEFWVGLFGWLRWVSLLYLIRRYVPKAWVSPYMFVDLWVMGHVVLAVVLLAASMHSGFTWWEAVFAFYAGFRILEILVQQINGLLFDEYRAAKRGERYIVGYRRALILVLNSYIEVLFWFALFYRNAASAFEPKNVVLDSFIESFRLSYKTMTTWGHSQFTPSDNIGHTLIFLQSVVGLLMFLMVLVGFLALISRRRAEPQARPQPPPASQEEPLPQQPPPAPREAPPSQQSSPAPREEPPRQQPAQGQGNQPANESG